MLTHSQVNLLKAFNLNQVHFIVIGMSSAIIQGVGATTQNFDLWFEELGSKNFVEAVKSVGGFYIPPNLAGGNPPMLGPTELRLFDIVTTVHGLGSFQEEYKSSLLVELQTIPLRILPLERIIVNKKAVAREKDLAVLPILEQSLACILKKDL
jgi:hypothetical protein